ncbi:MAG: alkaline phosphatase family protein [Actinobacteria bacterium]|nr:alkaline phosphatase family protein [Actinomycetota bacterium]
MPTRVLIVAGAAALVAALAVYALSPVRGLPSGAPTETEMAGAIGSQIMSHLYLGHVPGRSGEVMMVPKPHTYLTNDLDLTALGTGAPPLNSSHPNPWAYTARIPLIFYGPPWVPEGLAVSADADAADVAPTYARLVGMDDFVAAGEPLEDIAPKEDRPKVVFTVVIDGGGWNVLQEHSESWPFLRRLIERGTSYTNATIGSAPSITGAIHATFGTGFYPIDHGIPGNQLRGPKGPTDAWELNANPIYLEKPTVSELWDEASGNEAVVATLAYEGWHLGMIGHGAARPGGDHDVAVLWEEEDNAWHINEEFFELPSYLETTDIELLESYEEKLDGRDGVHDGTWFGETLEELQVNTVRPGTSAFVRFNGDAVVEMMRKEKIGADSVTDFFWVETKMPDYAGHRWNMLAPEIGDVVAEVDHQIARFKKELDRLAGKGNYVLAISADHGQEPLPEHFGGWRVDAQELSRDVEERFGVGVVEKVTTVDFFMDMDRVQEEGIALEDVARYLGTYTIGDNVPDDAPGADRIPAARVDDELFAGAFSTEYLQSLSPEDISSFGESDYPEGDLIIEPGGR